MGASIFNALGPAGVHESSALAGVVLSTMRGKGRLRKALYNLFVPS